MANHAVGASSTQEWTVNNYQSIATTVNHTSSLSGTLSAGDTFTLANDGGTILVLYISTSGTGTVTALASGNNISMTLTATGTYVVGPLDPNVFGTSVSISTTTAAGNYQTFALTPAFHNPLHSPFETSATAVDH